MQSFIGERSWSAWNRWRDRRADFCRCKWQVYGAVSARFVQIFLFFHFELTGKFKDRAPAPFAPQAWPTSWRTIWRCSQILRSATLSRLSKASSWTSLFVHLIISLLPGWPREVIDSESLNKILSSLDGQWQKWILCFSCQESESTQCPGPNFFAGLAAKRCESWENTERLQLALIWASYSFRCDLIPYFLIFLVLKILASWYLNLKSFPGRLKWSFAAPPYNSAQNPSPPFLFPLSFNIYFLCLIEQMIG